jgi:N-acetylglucosaminyldiphosphoundecaprenol N-acetyl-beta-D-mannosaminyltransferase
MNSQLKILGNKIDCFKGYPELYKSVLENYKSGNVQRGYVTVNNVHTMMVGFWDASFQAIINKGYLSIPDGKPLEIVGRLKGKKEISRLFGPSVMEKFIDWGRSDGLSHFFFGSSEITLMKLKEAIEVKYPGAKIAGMLSPPYTPTEEWNHEEFIQKINIAKPDFIWVGLGAPKQEWWIHDHYKKIDNGILFGIGAGFDYLTGNTSHAPAWMKKFALEWLYRLIQEPGRLWKRYLKTIPQFIFFGLLELLGVKFR